MLPSTGLFKEIPCPFFDSGLCQRPYCHYRHSRKDSPSKISTTVSLKPGNENILKQLVSEAVKKVLKQKENSVKVVSSSSSESTSQASPKSCNDKLSVRNADDSIQNSAKGSSEQTIVPSYKPTPISELKKRHIPILYSPALTKSSNIVIKRKAPSDLFNAQKKVKFKQECEPDSSNVEKVNEVQTMNTAASEQKDKLRSNSECVMGNILSKENSFYQSNVSGAVSSTSHEISKDSETPRCESFYKPRDKKIQYSPSPAHGKSENFHSYIPSNIELLHSQQNSYVPIGPVSAVKYEPSVKSKSCSEPTYVPSGVGDSSVDSNMYKPSTVSNMEPEYQPHTTEPFTKEYIPTDISKLDYRILDNVEEELDLLSDLLEGDLGETGTDSDREQSIKEVSLKNDENSNFSAAEEKSFSSESAMRIKIAGSDNLGSSLIGMKSEKVSNEIKKNQEQKKLDYDKHYKDLKVKHDNKQKKNESKHSRDDRKRNRHRTHHITRKDKKKEKNTESDHERKKRDGHSKSRGDGNKHTTKNKKHSSELGKHSSSNNKKRNSDSESRSKHKKVEFEGKIHKNKPRNKTEQSDSTSSKSKSHSSKNDEKHFTTDRSSHSKQKHSKSTTSKHEVCRKESPHDVSLRKISDRHIRKQSRSKQGSSSKASSDESSEEDSAESDALSSDSIIVLDTYPADDVQEISSDDEITSACMSIFQELEEPLKVTSLPSISKSDAAERLKNIPANQSATTGSASGSSQPSTNLPTGRVRIAHVPNVTSLLNAKSRFLEQLKERQEQYKKLKPTSSSMAEAVKTKTDVGALAQGPLSRPVIEETAGKFESSLRQRYLDLLVNEYLTLSTSEREAYLKASEEEKAIYERCSYRNVYTMCMTSAIKLIRKKYNAAMLEAMATEPSTLNKGTEPSTSKKDTATRKTISHDAMLRGKIATKGTWSVEKTKKINILTDANIYERFLPFVLTETQLRNNGYAEFIPGENGVAVIHNPYRKVTPAVLENQRFCERCTRAFSVDEDGVQTSSERCYFHSGKRIKQLVHRVAEFIYKCCGETAAGEPCSDADHHVSDGYDPSTMQGFVQTRPLHSDDQDYGVYALDCEMCYTVRGREVTRVSVVGTDLKVVYDQLVRPECLVLDYVTKFSGITAEKMMDVTTTLHDVQHDLLSFIGDKTILVGHSLENDLKVLKIIHKMVVDTSVVYPHSYPPKKQALKILAHNVLQKTIQEDDSGHDSTEDARTCIELMLKKINDTR